MPFCPKSSHLTVQTVTITLTSGSVVYNNSYVENGILHIDALLSVSLTNDSTAIGTINVTPPQEFGITGVAMNGYFKTQCAVGGYINQSKQIVLSAQSSVSSAFVTIQGTKIL